MIFDHLITFVVEASDRNKVIETWYEATPCNFNDLLDRMLYFCKCPFDVEYLFDRDVGKSFELSRHADVDFVKLVAVAQDCLESRFASFEHALYGLPMFDRFSQIDQFVDRYCSKPERFSRPPFSSAKPRHFRCFTFSIVFQNHFRFGLFSIFAAFSYFMLDRYWSVRSSTA